MEQAQTQVTFHEAFETWLAASQKIVDDNWIGMTHAMSPILKARQGDRFIIVSRNDRSLSGIVSDKGSAHAFIDTTGGLIDGVPHKVGDVLKPASWRRPAKHARGNIFDPSGIATMGPYGPAYLRK